MKLDFCAGVKYGNRIYFSELSCLKGLFSMDLRDGKVEFLNTFAKETAASRLHRMAFLYGNEAWFIPEEGEYIVCLNLDTLEMEYYIVPHHTRNTVTVHGDYSVYTSGFVQKDRYLFLIPREIDAVLIIDMELHKMYPFYDMVNPKRARIADGIVYGDHLYLLPERGKVYIKIDLTSGKRTEITRNDREFTPGSVCSAGGKIWFAPWEQGDIICRNISDGNEFSLHVPEQGNLYYRMVVSGDKLIFLPFIATGFLIVDMSTLRTRIIHMDADIYMTGICTVIGATDEILINVGATGNVVSIDKDAHDFAAFSADISSDRLCMQVVQYIERSGGSDRVDLSVMIDALQELFGADGCVFYENEGMTALARYTGFQHLTYRRLQYKDRIQRSRLENVGQEIWSKLKNTL